MFPAFVGVIVTLVVAFTGGTVGAVETTAVGVTVVTFTMEGETVTVAVGTIVGFGVDVHPAMRMASVAIRITAILVFAWIAITRNSILWSAVKGFGTL